MGTKSSRQKKAYQKVPLKDEKLDRFQSKSVFIVFYFAESEEIAFRVKHSEPRSNGGLGELGFFQIYLASRAEKSLIKARQLYGIKLVENFLNGAEKSKSFLV